MTNKPDLVTTGLGAAAANKPDLVTTGLGAAAATWLGMGELDAALAVVVAGLTICLLVLRIGLAIKEWRRS